MFGGKMKKIIDLFDVELLIKSLFLWVFLYSSFIALVEVTLCYILFSVFIYAFILYFSLTPPNEKIVKNIFGENPRIRLRDSTDLSLVNNSELNRSFSIAHNAAVLDFNENNAEALRLCSKYGCQLIFLDVHVTKDNVLVVQRNFKFRLENEDHNATKSIPQYNLNDFISKQKPNLCTLDEILPTVENLDVRIIFNIIHPYYKSSNSVISALLKIYEKNPFLYQKGVICSSNPIILYSVRKNDPSVIVALKWSEKSEQSPTSVSISWLKKLHCSNSVKHFILEYVDSCSWWLLNHFFYRIIGISAVILPKKIITPKIVEDWDRKNVRCIVGIVNLSMEKTYYANALGVPFLTDTLLNVN
ncbi:glycerophosphodiester phosphodiesterase 1-like [Planococcus citri]|uniref:glycerophosphodiester phosphodiesterase 1-like n=1 Tax=Planococcus citri TaxID=170843 RepID=UPI0031F7331E